MPLDAPGTTNYAITAVRVDAWGRISRALMDRVATADTVGPSLVLAGTPSVFAATEIARFIDEGAQVYSAFLSNGAWITGPSFRSVLYDELARGIELSRDVAGKTYRDLIQLAE